MSISKHIGNADLLKDDQLSDLARPRLLEHLNFFQKQMIMTFIGRSYSEACACYVQALKIQIFLQDDMLHTIKCHSSLLCLKFHKKISIEKITNHRHCLVFVRSRGNFARFGSASAKLRYVDAKGAQVGRTNSCTKVAKKKQAKSICCNSYHSREYSFVSSSLNK